MGVVRIDVTRKRAGLLVPVFALRRRGDLGIGDTEAVREAVDFCAAQGFSVLQVLPINETGGDNSPYNAISSIALDPVYLTLSPGTVPGITAELMDEVAPPHERLELAEGPVRYPLVKELKHRLLGYAFAAFEEQHLAPGTSLAAEFEAFVRDEADWLGAYTLFRTILNEREGDAVWTDWPEAFATPEAAEAWAADPERHEEIHRYREFWAWVQWLCFRQWREVKRHAEAKGVQLMGDIPFGVSRYSADVWAAPHLFDLEWSGGAPPEPFFATDLFVKRWGQNWGIPLYDWEAHRAEDFAWWRQRVGKLEACFHLFRIDHVLGLFRIYAFPWLPQENARFAELSEDEALALTGGLKPGFHQVPDDTPEHQEINAAQGRELLEMILEASGPVGLVAEDLGVVPPYVRPMLQEMKIPGFSIPTFDRNEQTREFRPKDDAPMVSVATYGTHDHDPLRTFYSKLCEIWHGPDGHEGWLEVQRLMRFLGRDDENPPASFTPDLHESFIDALFTMPSWLAVLMVTDYFGTAQRFNLPGSASDANWSQRLEAPLAEMARSPAHAGTVAMVARHIRSSGRDAGEGC